MKNIASTINRNPYLILVSLVFSFFLFSWFVVQYSNSTYLLELYADTYGMVTLFAGVYGLYMSKKWGYFSSVFGKAIIFLSLGLLAQGFGQAVYSIYYLVFGISAPYPSVGDIGFFGSIPLYIFGVWYLAMASGVKYVLRSKTYIILSVSVVALLLSVSYQFFLNGYDFSEVPYLVIFLDFGYPLGQAVYVSMALIVALLSRKMLGGVMKKRVWLLLIALLFQYVSDFTFLYQFNRDTWTAGGINDFMYLISYFTLFIAMVDIETAFLSLTDVSDTK